MMQTLPLKIERYCDTYREIWNQTISTVRQSSFLFHRDFIEYHQDRYIDHSLLIFDQHSHIIALFPACHSHKSPLRVESHGGLTYGGLLLCMQATTISVDNILKALQDYYFSLGFREILYKPVPYIYHKYPAEEDLYALFRHHALLYSRSVSTVIDLSHPYPFSKLRQRKVNKASRYLKYVEVDSKAGIAPFWRLLSNVLLKRHGVPPVHNLVELQYLSSRFPDYIRLFTAIPVDSDNSSYESPLAGCLLFVTSRVIHVQYIASSDEGCLLGALDGLFDYLVHILPLQFPDTPYLDFGISTENGGYYLNQGLIFQKEGFGGRAVCYDSYLLKLT